MGDLDKLEKIKKELEDSKEKQAEIRGKISAKMDRLNELGYPSIEKATEAMKQLGKEIEIASKALDDLFVAFEDEYPELFKD